jgi:hypothetical protein
MLLESTHCRSFSIAICYCKDLNLLTKPFLPKFLLLLHRSVILTVWFWNVNYYGKLFVFFFFSCVRTPGSFVFAILHNSFNSNFLAILEEWLNFEIAERNVLYKLLIHSCCVIHNQLQNDCNVLDSSECTLQNLRRCHKIRSENLIVFISKIDIQIPAFYQW